MLDAIVQVGGLLLGAVALGLGVYNFRRDRQRDRDSTKAHVIARAIVGAHSDEWFAELHNMGPGVAQNVQFTCENLRASAVPPIAAMAPGERVKYPMFPLSDYLLAACSLAWDDTSGRKMTSGALEQG